jgi:hypothetical protein
MAPRKEEQAKKKHERKLLYLHLFLPTLSMAIVTRFNHLSRATIPQPRKNRRVAWLLLALSVKVHALALLGPAASFRGDGRSCCRGTRIAKSCHPSPPML